MKIAVLGTGMVGQAIAARLSGLGHDVTIGTRDPQATLARTEPDGMGNPPFSAWAADHADVRLATLADAAAAANWSSTRRAGPPRFLPSSWPAPTSGARCSSTSPTRSTSRRASLPRCSSRTPTRSVSRSSAPSRRFGSSRPSTPSTPTSWSTRRASAPSPASSSGRRPVAKATVTELLRSFATPTSSTSATSAPRADRDAAPRVVAAHGRARHAGVQLQDRPLTMALMTGKTVLVTGGTGGIGGATAAGLAGLGAGSASSDATSAPRRLRRGSAPQAGRSTSSPPMSRRSGRCAASRKRRSRHTRVWTCW